MNNTIRKLLSFAICFIFVFSSSANCFANTVSSEHIHLEETIEPKYISCPEGGKHVMRGIGYVPCYNGSSSGGTADFYGYGTQCTKCYLVLVTEYPANVSTCTKWGTYVVCSANEPAATFTVVLNATYSYSESIYGDFEQGFEFIITA